MIHAGLGVSSAMSYALLGKLAWAFVCRSDTDPGTSTPCQRFKANHADQAGKCSFHIADHAPGADEQHGMLIEQLQSATTILSPGDPSSSLAATEFGWTAHLSEMEKRLLHHACTINSNLSTTIQSGHVTGLSQFSKCGIHLRPCGVQRD